MEKKLSLTDEQRELLLALLEDERRGRDNSARSATRDEAVGPDPRESGQRTRLVDELIRRLRAEEVH